jgi:hypothetical protein
VSQEERSILWEDTVSVILSKNIYAYKSYSERFPEYGYFTVQLKIVDKKEILRTASNTGIYCLSDKAGTVYLV